MASKKRKAKANASSQQKKQGVRWTSSSHTAVVSALGVVFALIWTYIKNMNDVDDWSLQDLLEMVRRSDSFDLTNISTRTLSATSDIPSGTIYSVLPLYFHS